MVEFSPSGSQREAADAARLIYESDPPYYDFWFGAADAAHTCLEKLWLAPVGSLSYAHSSVWRENGQLLALASHYPSNHESQLAQADAEQQSLLHGDLEQMNQRGTMLSWLFPHLPDDIWYLQTLAVSASRRGSGLGKQIMNQIENTARSHGALALHTDVDSANMGALRFYQTQGFEIVARTTVPALEVFRLPESLRMVKKLF